MSRVFSIPAGVPFADALAAGLLEATRDNPLSLSDYLIFLPTRRTCRTVQDAFLRQSNGQALLLPRLMPLGDIDADELALTGAVTIPPALAPRRRQLLLAQLVARFHPEWPGPQHLAMARELARLIDEITTEGAQFEQIDSLTPSELSAHWQTTLDFLKPVFAHWPAILESENAIDASDRRNRLIEAQIHNWQANPPQTPVLMAGNPGTVPATHRLLKAILALPHGQIVLPGLPDTAEADSWWSAVDAPHPLFGLKSVLKKLDVPLSEVALWSGVTSDQREKTAARRHFLLTSLLPAQASAGWVRLPHSLAQGTDGLARMEAGHEQEEATALALSLRETLEVPGQTAMLVTADRTLGRRVAEIMKRWDIQIDDSAGTPLAKTDPAIFLRLLMDAIEDGLSPVRLLSLLKHPLTACGLAPSECRARTRQLERVVLRGPKPEPWIEGLLSRLEAEKHPQLMTWLTALDHATAPLKRALAQPTLTLTALLTALVHTGEALATSNDTEGANRLWRGEAGEALADWVSDLLAAAADFPPLAARDAGETLFVLMQDVVVRPRYGDHPRLSILGPLEARLQQADLVLLGGLNEGGWPSPPPPDPWLSRPMRRDFGLPDAEERVGQQAHDFFLLACSPRVTLSRSTRAGGTPTVASRWLRRLDMVLQAIACTDPFTVGETALTLTRALDRPDRYQPQSRPTPCPPLALRPNRLSVTEVEKLRTDPYSIYAKRILELSPLDDLEPEIGAADRGTFIHDVLGSFITLHKDTLPSDERALTELMQIGEEKLVAHGLASERAYWWPRFMRIANWFIAQERAQRDISTPVGIEVKGTLPITEAFTLTARADRIDRTRSGEWLIIDYKTGTPPAPKLRTGGFSAQLPLEAAMARSGGFRDLEAAPVAGMEFWQVSGGHPAGKVDPFSKKETPEVLANRALDQLRELVLHFATPSSTYLPEPNSDLRSPYNDYAHLARFKEWASEEDAG